MMCPAGETLGGLAERARAFGHRVMQIEHPTELAELTARRNFRPRVVIVDVSYPTEDWSKLVRELRSGAGPEAVCFFATGEAPKEKERKALRKAGFEIGLFHPVPDHALRFYLARGARSAGGQFPRGDDRIPTAWVTRVFAGGREKMAQVYSFSPTGAYLATRQPSLTGSEIAIDLPLDSGMVTTTGRVVYTNVPGNLSRPHLPIGMAVRFTQTPAEDQQKIRESVARAAALFSI